MTWGQLGGLIIARHIASVSVDNIIVNGTELLRPRIGDTHQVAMINNWLPTCGVAHLLFEYLTYHHDQSEGLWLWCGYTTTQPRMDTDTHKISCRV